ncbi:hypothetical protein MEG1DRAFT_00228 [Photorhabdus temperata subsp. temperata Meg1]|uniref:Transposase n=1 Tax=Photorhabdus temperata subsp. temperata Meg1 TaxID=1393735 RepID=A0A081S1N9_PHOTE|nr:hypothetical protein MEG1DRAFT_00228 [Photorhabdus temperata subsp. temperata Meg1]
MCKDLLTGLALCTYSIDEESFEIHMIENFYRDDAKHPLNGKMFQLTLMAAYMFCKSAQVNISGSLSLLKK